MQFIAWILLENKTHVVTGEAAAALGLTAVQERKLINRLSQQRLLDRLRKWPAKNRCGLRMRQRPGSAANAEREVSARNRSIVRFTVHPGRPQRVAWTLGDVSCKSAALWGKSGKTMLQNHFGPHGDFTGKPVKSGLWAPLFESHLKNNKLVSRYHK